MCKVNKLRAYKTCYPHTFQDRDRCHIFFNIHGHVKEKVGVYYGVYIVVVKELEIQNRGILVNLRMIVCTAVIIH